MELLAVGTQDMGTKWEREGEFLIPYHPVWADVSNQDPTLQWQWVDGAIGYFKPTFLFV